MDDISFFESAQYQHRGGIWADASRHERAPTLDGEQPSSTDGSPTSSASPADGPRTDSGEAQATPIPRSRSAEEVEKTSSSGSLPEPELVARSTTVDATTPAGLSTSPGTKRRTWFSSGQEESDVFANAPSNPAVTENDVSRGRTLSHDAKAERRSSLPAFVNPPATQEDSAQREDDRDTGDEGQYLSPAPQGRRSASQHSRSASSRAASVSSSHGGDVSDDSSDAQMASYRSKSPAPPGSSPRQTPASPGGSSFFQTLKSRADKQALSNTAKETMRKWGVNWGNFRRETLGSSGSGSGSGGAGSADEGVPDAGHGDPRRIDSRTSVPRPSYADVRAAVEERRERERAPLQEASSRSNTQASEPIPVPQNVKGKERAESVSPSNTNAPPAVSPVPKADVAAGAMPRSESPVPIERSASQASSSSHQSASHALGIAPEEPERRSEPIHTQPPPPKTMTIPGIHASHRGEVMSMGYAPPPPPAGQQEQKKAPLQSVYRLWKNPGNATSSTPRGEPAPVSQTGFTGRDQDSVPPPPSEEESEPTPRPPRPPAASVPPPLPPRANSTHVLHTKSEVTRVSDTDTASLSKASAALQSIVSKDRVKRASLTPPTSVPSSPGQDSDMPSAPASLDGAADALDAAASPASITPTPSSPPSPPLPQGPNGRGPPPALPPRRQRTAS